jgi:uncharacterized protein (DUF362 family)/Pyruvate/2-oxoacid:ferredoxin oxidoreductase delta subunit
VSCPDYEPVRVAGAVRRGLDLLGWDWLAGPLAQGRPLVLKPNLLRPSPPEKGVTTHPAVFTAVASCLQARGVPLAWGDSPNGIFAPRAAAERAGILAAADARGIPMADFENGEEVSDSRGGRYRRFTIARGARESAGIVNLPRLKTHSLTRLTGALKNTFGAVVGSEKAGLHIRHPDAGSFGRMIADVNLLVPTRLAVMDAVTVMEGNGPAAGTLVDLGLLVISTDPVAVDAVACAILGIEPLSLPFLAAGAASGLGTADLESIEVRGEPLARWTGRRFSVPARNLVKAVPPGLWRLARSLFIGRPVIDARACVACGECVSSCPTSPKSLAQEPGEVPCYDYGTCIRCYCCQETCPEGAISVRPAPLAGFLGGPAEVRKRRQGS